jgi:hypothetical protein
MQKYSDIYARLALKFMLYNRDLQTMARDVILSGPQKNCAEMRQMN